MREPDALRTYFPLLLLFHFELENGTGTGIYERLVREIRRNCCLRCRTLGDGLEREWVLAKAWPALTSADHTVVDTDERQSHHRRRRTRPSYSVMASVADHDFSGARNDQAIVCRCRRIRGFVGGRLAAGSSFPGRRVRLEEGRAGDG